MEKLWAYVIGKELTDEEHTTLLKKGEDFINGWTAHDKKLAAKFDIHKKRIILVQVNESHYNASGCSIDKLTRFMKETGREMGFDPLDRFLIAYKNGENVGVIHTSAIRKLLEEKVMTENTVIYNTTITSGDELSGWEQPLKSTWLNRYLEKI